MKKINRRSFLKALGAVSAASALAACGSGGSSSTASSAAGSTAAASTAASASTSEPVTLRITWWGGQSRHDYTQQLLDLYTQQNPNITFEAVPSGWDGYFEKLATDTATGGMPDIVQMDYMYITTYANNGSLAELSSYTSNGSLDLTNVDESLISTGKVNGDFIAVPLSSTVMAYSYNPSVLEEAGVAAPENGWTWDDFNAAALAVKENTGKAGLGFSPVEEITTLSYWARQHGYALFADDNKSLGYEDDSITASFFQQWLDLINAGTMPNPDEWEQIATLGKEGGTVITGDAAFRQDWNNYTVIAAQAGNDTLKMVAPPVGFTNEKALWYKPSMFFSVAETSEHKAEAVAFINWFINNEEANDIIMGERGVPASSVIREHLVNSGTLSDQQVDMFNYTTDVAPYCSEAPAPDPAGISEINTTFENIAYSVFYGQTTPEAAAAEFRSQADAILAANN